MVSEFHLVSIARTGNLNDVFVRSQHTFRSSRSAGEWKTRLASFFSYSMLARGNTILEKETYLCDRLATLPHILGIYVVRFLNLTNDLLDISSVCRLPCGVKFVIICRVLAIGGGSVVAVLRRVGIFVITVGVFTTVFIVRVFVVVSGLRTLSCLYKAR